MQILHAARARITGTTPRNTLTRDDLPSVSAHYGPNASKAQDPSSRSMKNLHETRADGGLAARRDVLGRSGPGELLSACQTGLSDISCPCRRHALNQRVAAISGALLFSHPQYAAPKRDIHTLPKHQSSSSHAVGVVVVGALLVLVFLFIR
ncbi:hypothetical protein T492DRAFT_520120 [Pavlovales sp. CCMP2436]|nr:hypothetical protein T492DRAFT_520120 [Pavlovales sp. CCMP2436]